jgi:hypothetical protein
MAWALGALVAPMLVNLLLIREGEPFAGATFALSNHAGSGLVCDSPNCPLATAAAVWSLGVSFVAGIVCMAVILPRIQLKAIAKILIGFVIMAVGTVAASIGAVLGCSAGGIGRRGRCVWGFLSVGLLSSASLVSCC